LVLGSLGLVAYGHWPKNPDEWVGLGKSMAPYGISCMGALVAVVFIAQFLPSMPMTSKLFLKPPDNDDQPLFAEDELHQGLAGLLGSIGVAETNLHPSGKARIGDHWLDVVSDGGFIIQGAKIKVCQIEGGKIVVSEVL
jgi:membrane-bound serine protease (ClpP class)